MDVSGPPDLTGSACRGWGARGDCVIVPHSDAVAGGVGGAPTFGRAQKFTNALATAHHSVSMPSTPDTSVLSRHNDADPSLVAGLEEQLGGGRPQVRKQVRIWTRGLVDPLIKSVGAGARDRID